MKKMIILILCMVVAFIFAGCGNAGLSSAKAGQNTGVNDVIESGMAEEDNKDGVSGQISGDTGNNRQNGVNENAPEPEPAAEENLFPAGAEGLDVDLTVLSSTMVYSEVYNMMISPDDYLGKSVKMKGLFAMYHDEAADKYYFACIIQDATACCSQGIEFVLTDDYIYPDDYPEPGSEICVTGIFDTYMEGQRRYCTLREAKLV